MTPTPTAPDRAARPAAAFTTLTEALDFAAEGPTGINMHGLRGELVARLSYGDLRAAARKVARRLLAAGLQPGDRVGMAAETSADFVTAFFACQYAGLAPAPLPLPAPLGGREFYAAQIAQMLRSAEAGAVLGSAELKPWLEEAASAAGVGLCATLADLPQAEDGPLPQVRADDVSYVQFSSGSTRTPTGVVVTHAALMANCGAITSDGLKTTPADRAFSWLPLYHDMGLVGFVLTPVSFQMTVDLMPTGAFVRRPLLWLDLMSRYGTTTTYSPTFGYQLCAQRAATGLPPGLDLSSVRVAGVGGDMVRPGPLEAFADRFSEAGFDRRAFVASYGMAEATLALTMAPLGQGLRVDRLDVERLEREAHAAVRAGAVRERGFVRCGPVLPGHQLEVRDEDGGALGEGRVGRIFVRGPSIMRGYFGLDAETRRVLSSDGWLDTGDLGYLADGEIVPTGRAKDLILLNGRNIWPQDLEWTAEAEIAGLRSGDVAAFALSEEEGEAVVILVQARTSEPEARRRLAEDVTTVLRARHGLEAQVHLVGSHALPLTSSGKLSRSKARSMFLSGGFGAAAEPA
jgi:fatty-acyl-CoA synthase